MVSQPIDLLGQPIGRYLLQNLHDARVKSPAPILEKALVYHFVRQSMLESIFDVGEESDFVEEFRGLQTCQPAAKIVPSETSNGLQQVEGHILADHRSRLKELFVLRREPVNSGCQDRLYRGGNVNRRRRSPQPVRSAVADQHLGLDQRPDALLQKQWIALGALDE